MNDLWRILNTFQGWFEALLLILSNLSQQGFSQKLLRAKITCYRVDDQKQVTRGEAGTLELLFQDL